MNNEAFISLTAHGIDPDSMKSENLVLNCKHFPDSHTSINIKLLLEETLVEWQLPSEKIHLILRDNASNMRLGISE